MWLVFLICVQLICTVSVPDLKEMCELLGIDQSVLERAFSFRTVEAKMEKVSTTLNVAQVRLTLHLLPHIISVPTSSLLALTRYFLYASLFGASNRYYSSGIIP